MPKYIYLISDKKTYYYKIGVSKNPETRLKQLQTGNQSKLTLNKKVLCENYNEVEQSLHNKYSMFRINGEWFELTDDDVNSFEDDCKLIDNAIKQIKKI